VIVEEKVQNMYLIVVVFPQKYIFVPIFLYCPCAYIITQTFCCIVFVSP